jgi:hypothetical protein
LFCLLHQEVDLRVGFSGFSGGKKEREGGRERKRKSEKFHPYNASKVNKEILTQLL